MLYLNNPLLTHEGIISFFEKNVIGKEHPAASKAPSPLRQFQNKLKSIFFEQMDKSASAESVVTQLETDARFTTNYPKLKQVLKILFSLTDTDAKTTALQTLKTIEGSDWNTFKANAQWDELNDQYGYFNSVSAEHRDLFIKLAVACRAMIVLFEKNNTPDDTMAYSYAYKLMALYVDPDHLSTLDTLSKDIHNLVNQVNSDKEHPFHEALLVKLEPLPHARALSDKAGWRKLVKKEGINAFQFLLMAQRIEEKIAAQPHETHKRAPKDLKEATAMAMLCRYNRISESPAFAELCHRYKVPEHRFNHCLDYIAEVPGWPKKDHDAIPDITVTGQAEAEGLYWVKLPITDKRALILGDITDCCQSIDGHSEPCVKNAVSLPDNGLYVLVKQRKKGNPPLTLGGEINDKDFKIIGQSYVWRSMTGNLCLDSIECLSDEVSDVAIQRIITDFSHQVLNNNPAIKYVTVGCGGKTPQGLFENAAIPEMMRQGYSYGDADTQYCIAKKSLPLDSAQQEARQAEFSGLPQDWINYLTPYMTEHDATNPLFSTMKNLFATGHDAQTNRQNVAKHHDSNSLFFALTKLIERGLFTSETAQATFDMLVNHSSPTVLAEAFAVLNNTNLLAGEGAQANFDALIQHQEPWLLAKALVILKEADWLTGEVAQIYRNALLQHHNPMVLIDFMPIFKKTDVLNGEAAQATFNAVVLHNEPDSCAKALAILKETNLLTGDKAQTNIEVVAQLEHPWMLVETLVILQEAGLLVGEAGQANFDAVVRHDNPFSLTKDLARLKEVGLLAGEMAQASLDAMIQYQGPTKVFIWRILSTLLKTDLLSGEMAQANLDAVIKHQGPTKSLSWLLQTLQKKGLLTDEIAQANFDAVLAHQNPHELAKTLSTLLKADLLSGEAAQVNFDAVVKHQNLPEILKSLNTCQKSGLLNQTKFNELVGTADAETRLEAASASYQHSMKAEINKITARVEPETQEPRGNRSNKGSIL